MAAEPRRDGVEADRGDEGRSRTEGREVGLAASGVTTASRLEPLDDRHARKLEVVVVAHEPEPIDLGDLESAHAHVLARQAAHGDLEDGVAVHLGHLAQRVDGPGARSYTSELLDRREVADARHAATTEPPKNGVLADPQFSGEPDLRLALLAQPGTELLASTLLGHDRLVTDQPGKVKPPPPRYFVGDSWS
jgi:hypothetical protein